MRVDEVDLHLADAAVQVTHQATARTEFTDPPDQLSGGREADEAKGRSGGVVGVLPEDEHDPDQIREVPEVSDPVSAEQKRRVERAPQSHEPVDDLTSLRGSKEEPDLVEADDLVARAITRDQLQRVGRDERERRDGHPLSSRIRISCRRRFR